MTRLLLVFFFGRIIIGLICAQGMKGGVSKGPRRAPRRNYVLTYPCEVLWILTVVCHNGHRRVVSRLVGREPKFEKVKQLAVVVLG